MRTELAGLLANRSVNSEPSHPKMLVIGADNQQYFESFQTSFIQNNREWILDYNRLAIGCMQGGCESVTDTPIDAEVATVGNREAS